MSLYGSWLLKTAITTAGLILIVTLLGHYVLVNKIYDTSLIKIDEDVNTLIVGASHSATAMDPQYFDQAISVSRSGEPLFFTYYKVKKILEINKNINNLIVAISPIHIGPYSDAFFFKGDSASRIYSMDYYMFVDNQNDELLPVMSSDRTISWLKYMVGVPFNYMDDLKVIYNYYFGKFDIQAYSYFGGFEKVEGVNWSEPDIKEKAKFYFYDENGEISFTKIGKESIRRLFQLCESKDIRISLVNIPAHSLFLQQVPKVITDEYYRFINEERAKYNCVEFYDYSSLELPQEYFYDGDHLNYEGSKYFSRIVSRDIKVRQGIIKSL